MKSNPEAARSAWNGIVTWLKSMEVQDNVSSNSDNNNNNNMGTHGNKGLNSNSFGDSLDSVHLSESFMAFKNLCATIRSDEPIASVCDTHSH